MELFKYFICVFSIAVFFPIVLTERWQRRNTEIGAHTALPIGGFLVLDARYQWKTGRMVKHNPNVRS